MQFDSLTFLVFFSLVCCGYALINPWAQRKNLLLLASYIFYAAWNPFFLPLLIGTSLLDWHLAQKMAKAQGVLPRKLWLWTILGTNLGILAFFKYAYFFSDSLSTAGQLLGLDWQAEPFSIVLPIGISFYTFHSLSYCIDVYRGKFAPVTHLRDYLLYVSFFPQLVAGPIVRWSEMRDQIERPRHMELKSTGIGLCLMIVGLFEKIVLADAVFAPVANTFFGDAAQYTQSGEAWLAALAFSGQIFCDFAGYTTCALGAALVLGFRLPINFLNPYAALGFSDFWQRWHISLSTWLRDYLYIGLGGNRRGKLLTYRNLMLTMLVGGLWHGAAWTFVIWGGIHGTLLILERMVKNVFTGTFTRGTALFRPLGRLATFFIITLSWVWFRAPDTHAAWAITKSMLSLQLGDIGNLQLSGVQMLSTITIAALVAGQWAIRNQTVASLINKSPAIVTGLAAGLLLALIILSPGESHAFIYFQF